jgi:hypothetical protein
VANYPIRDQEKFRNRWERDLEEQRIDEAHVSFPTENERPRELTEFANWNHWWNVGRSSANGMVWLMLCILSTYLAVKEVTVSVAVEFYLYLPARQPVGGGRRFLYLYISGFYPHR